MKCGASVAFIRDFIKAEKKTRNSVARSAAEDIRGVCGNIEILADKYPYMDSEKLRSIIAATARNEYTFCTERQMKFLTRTLDDLKMYHASKTAKGLLESLDLDAEISEGLFG